MTRPKASRDFLLDSGGLSHLAESDQRMAGWLDEITSAYDQPMVFVPVFVLSECLSGKPRDDTKIRRLTKRLDVAAAPESCWLHLTMTTAERAGVSVARRSTGGGGWRRRGAPSALSTLR